MLPSPPNSHDCSDRSDATKPKTVRRNPEKRRQQNVQAQKKYREKLKRRLDFLERLETSNSNGEASNVAYSSNQSAIDPHLLEGSATIVEDHINEAMGASNGLRNFSSDLSLWNPTTFDEAFLLHDSLVSPERVTHVDCGCIAPHLTIMSLGGSKEYRDSQLDNDEQLRFPLDLHINTLRIERLCVIRAVLSNCEHIGITEQMICDEDAISPFFRPTSGANDAGTLSVVSKVQDIFSTLKSDVRPGREQIVNLHHPVIDILPFPTFRQNLIANQAAIDQDELFDDLINGLVCWGRAGLSRKEQNTSDSVAPSGTPWDSRSWEGRTWFLQKYWTVLGGQDGELVRQSDWWRNLRGDEDDGGLASGLKEN